MVGLLCHIPMHFIVKLPEDYYDSQLCSLLVYFGFRPPGTAPAPHLAHWRPGKLLSGGAGFSFTAWGWGGEVFLGFWDLDLGSMGTKAVDLVV